MKSPKHVFLFTTILLLAMIVVACGGSTGSGGYGGYGNGGSKPAATTSTGGSTPAATTSTGSSNVVIQTAMATVKGKSTSILTNAKGMTLYYLSADTATQVMCSGGCAQIWPPLVETGSSLLGGPTSLPGKLSVVSTANGNQVEYNGHPLYTYSGDSAPGQTNGEGIQGVWHVVTPDLQLQGGSPNPY